MRVSEVSAEDAWLADQEDLFEMANLFPGTTGLPMTVWVSPRGGARHDVRIKINMQHGNQMNIHDTAVMSVRPTPQLLAGTLARDDLQAVSWWVSANADALVEYWDGHIDTLQLGQRLVRLPGTN